MKPPRYPRLPADSPVNIIAEKFGNTVARIGDICLYNPVEHEHPERRIKRGDRLVIALENNKAPDADAVVLGKVVVLDWVDPHEEYDCRLYVRFGRKAARLLRLLPGETCLDRGWNEHEVRKRGDFPPAWRPHPTLCYGFRDLGDLAAFIDFLAEPLKRKPKEPES